MTTFFSGTPVTPAFLYGTGAVVNVLMPAGNLALESGFAADGTIRLVIPSSTIGATTGTQVHSFLTRVRDEIVPGVAAPTPDNAPQDFMPGGDPYTVEGNCGATAVRVSGFSARATHGRVALTWRTAGETGILGFNVWRFAHVKGAKVNASLVVAKAAGRVGGASYRLVDRDVVAGVGYAYRLEVVGLDGTRRVGGGGERPRKEVTPRSS